MKRANLRRTASWPRCLAKPSRFQGRAPHLFALEQLEDRSLLSAMTIGIDVRPGNDQNTVNLASHGVLPVAILTTDEFSPNDMDQSSVTLRDPDLQGQATSMRSEGRDVDNDGDLDRVLFFRISELVSTGALGRFTDQVILTGKTVDGTVVKGIDTVRIVPRPASERGEAVHRRNFAVPLGGGCQVPSVETHATGVAKLQASKDGTELTFKINVANIEAVTEAHIHMGRPGENGPIVATLFESVEEGAAVRGTLVEGTLTDEDVMAHTGFDGTLAALLELLRGGDAYIDVHTRAHPSGEICGKTRPGKHAGDSNGDGRFNRFDIVKVLQANKYLAGEEAAWVDGDWNADGVFDQRDIVLALQTGNYRNTGKTPEAGG